MAAHNRWKTASVGAWSGLSLVIDTSAYAGNFERSLLVAATGVMPTYPDGYTEKTAEEFAHEKAHADLVGHVLNDSDDASFIDRCVIYPTPGWSNNGKGKHYRVTRSRPYKYPAFKSVRIPLTREPTAEEFGDIKRRALAFAASCSHPAGAFRITGFRLVEERTQTREKVLR